MILCANPAAQFQAHKDEIELAISNVLKSNRYILGPEVSAIETEFSRYIGVNYGIGVANGTDALEITLRALNIGEGDEVITVSHTAVATVAAIELVGAKAVLVDIDPSYYVMDCNGLKEVLTEKTKAVIAVHLYGQSVNMDELLQFTNRNNLTLIEDVSQAHGATWRGQKLGGFGAISCFSCYPTKNLGAIGDGGFILTNDDQLSRRIRMLREYGWEKRYVSDISGGRNSRLDELQAAILRVKLRHLDADNQKRRNIAEYYTQAFKNIPEIKVPIIQDEAESVFHLYAIQVDERDELINFLNKKEIYPGIHYPIPVHQQPAYINKLNTGKNMDNTEHISKHILSLPMYPELSSAEVDQVISSVTEFIISKRGHLN